ncbi:cation diffusion facilitator family transporter [Planctomycetota bacterium]
MPEERCIRCGNRVPWMSFWGNSAITVFKIAVGFLGGSAALIADGIHSFTDVIGTSVIIGTRNVSERPADECHPYGHGKAEFMGSTFIYTLLLFLAGAIFIGGLLVILEGDLKTPSFVTLLAAIVSVAYNVLMYLLGSCAGKRNNSPAILANAFENRADAISSVACIVGIAAAITIHPICDPIAAMIVGVIILVNCIIELNKSLAGLMDQAMPPESVGRIRRIVMGQEGVKEVDFIKTRQTGNDYWVDLGILVREDLDVARSDKIASAVRNELMRRSEKFQSVEVYVAPASRKTGKQRGFLRRRKPQEQPGEAG